MFVYFIRSVSKPKYTKIGYSACPEKRLNDLQIGCPFELKLVGCIRCENDAKAKNLEGHLHRRFASRRCYGEWFSGDIEFKDLGFDVLSDIDMQIAGYIQIKAPTRGQPLLMYAADVTLGALKFSELRKLRDKINKLLSLEAI